MDRVRELEVFVAVAEAGSFARAGARLRVSAPAVTRAVAALEERLGARVFNRTTRSLALTEAGARFLESAKHVLAALEEGERAVAGEGAAATGHLAVTAPVTFGRWAVAPVTSAFLKAHPGVTVSLTLLDRAVNLVEEGMDVAVRIGRLPDSTLVARRIGEVRRVLVASPAYLSAHGEPAAPQALAAHAIVGLTGLMANREWRYVDRGTGGRVALKPRFEVNDAVAAIEAAEAGDGITLALSYQVAEKIAQGRLVPVLQRYAPPPVPVQLVHPQARLVAPKIRAFADFAGPRLSDALARLPEIPAGAPPLRERRTPQHARL
ncbi:MAG TPA: LysR substrate-binding domain-containing protein [Anaeromyxobacteraceae bacterium]|nr:LysR substrate-binding domain-containing protein [Anaeromyxobacteraceae bacterium]